MYSIITTFLLVGGGLLVRLEAYFAIVRNKSLIYNVETTH